MEGNWLNTIGAGVIGGAVVKAIDYLYKEYRRRSDARTSAKALIEKHIDPILKAADELVGKIRSLAQSDFRGLKSAIPTEAHLDKCVDHLSIIYLFAQFWARVQILRIEGLFVNIGSDKRGKQLLQFFQTLEATRTRLVERAWQRGIGESILQHTAGGIRTFTFIEFAQRFLSDKDFRRWFRPLEVILHHNNHIRERQRLLTYGVVLHSLVNTLDPKHLVTRERPGWPNKLTRKSVRSLKYRVFGVYLRFVKEPKKYYHVGSSARKGALKI